MRGHLEGNTSSCAFRVLRLPLQLLFADSLERQTLQGEAVAFADLKTDLSADRVSCDIILARGNPHDSAVQPMSRDSVLRRDFQRKDCRVTISAVIFVSNLFGIAVYRQNIVADRAALPVFGLSCIEAGRQRGKMKSAVDRSDRTGVAFCFQFSQIGILTEIQTGEVGADTAQNFQLREIPDTGKIPDVLTIYIKLPHQRDFPCAEFAVPVSVNIYLRAEKKLPEFRVGEIRRVDGNVRAASRNRERENDVFQSRLGAAGVIGIGHDSGIFIHGKGASADCAALPVSGL